MIPLIIVCSLRGCMQSKSTDGRVVGIPNWPLLQDVPIFPWVSELLTPWNAGGGCQVESSRSQTSVRYLIGITTVSRLVSVMSPKPVCWGPITSLFYLSIARGHCRTDSLGSPITAKIVFIIAARTIFMCSMLVASINASSTYIQAGRLIHFPVPSIIPWLIVHGIARLFFMLWSIFSHFSISRYFLCLITRSGLVVNTLVRALMAHQKDSQLEADAVKPNTIAVARLYRSSARNQMLLLDPRGFLQIKNKPWHRPEQYIL